MKVLGGALAMIQTWEKVSKKNVEKRVKLTEELDVKVRGIAYGEESNMAYGKLNALFDKDPPEVGHFKIGQWEERGVNQ